MSLVDVPDAGDALDELAVDVMNVTDVMDVTDVTDVTVDLGPRCDGGLTLCGESCVDTRSSLAHCGRCDNACVPGARMNVSTSCNAGACRFDCNVNFASCDRDEANGCETDTRASMAHCGRCMNACVAPTGGTAACVMGACAATCPAGRHLCAGACVDNNAVATCGSSCMPCVAPTNGVATCDGTRCDFRCNTGYAREGDRCLLATPPRPIGPLSTSFATSTRPAFRWENAPGSTHTCVEFCRDRACTSVLRADAPVANATGDAGSAAVTRHQTRTALLTPMDARRVVWWRLYGCDAAGARTSVQSPFVWQLTIPFGTRDAPTPSAWGSGADFNGDGYGDAAVASIPPMSQYDGRVRIFYGNSTAAMGWRTPPTANLDVAAAMINPTTSAIRFGTTVANAGDLDGDGFSELVVTACSPSPTSIPHGGAFFYRGNTRDLAARAMDSAPWFSLTDVATPAVGCAKITRAGDLDGDGYGDVVLVIPSRGVQVLYGRSSTSTGTVPAPPAVLTNDGGATTAAALGDVTGDGADELAIEYQPAGAVRVYRGASDRRFPAEWTTVRIPARTLTPGSESQELLAPVGDSNADGLPDLVVHEPTMQRYRVWSWSPAMSAFTSAFPVTDTGRFGDVSYVTAGDMDGDGVSDVALGRPVRAMVVHTTRGFFDLAMPGSDAGVTRSTIVRATNDYNGDGLVDLLALVPTTNTAVVYFGQSMVGEFRNVGQLTTDTSTGPGVFLASRLRRHRAWL